MANTICTGYEDSDSLLECSDDNNIDTPTFKADMVRIPQTVDGTNSQLDQYIRTVSGNVDFDSQTDSKLHNNGKKYAVVSKQKRAKERELDVLQRGTEMSYSTELDIQVKAETCSRTSSLSSVRIEIQDLGEESINFTTSTLKKCKQLVLRPYWWLLVFIGWRAFKKDTVQSGAKKWAVFNFLYTSIIILLLFYTYSYEIMACQWRLDVQKDTHVITIPTKDPDVTTAVRPVNGSVDFSKLVPDLQPKATKNESQLAQSHYLVCDHMVTSYLVPNLLHLIAYIMGLYYFRIQENEQLYALMEKVFLQTSPILARTVSQHKMIVRLRLFLILGSLWVLMAVSLQGLYAWAFDFQSLFSFKHLGRLGYWLLFGFEIVGRTVFNSVILAIVMNFVTQCEMIKIYVKGLTMRLQEKSTDLKTAMKDILMLRHSLGILNGVISKMTSLAAFVLAELTIIGVLILFANEINKPVVWVYRGLFPFVWATMLMFPLFQAARVNSICLRIPKIAIEMRVFGYKGASILDLDSFLQFTSITKLKAKLLHMPILPSHLIFVIIVAAFTVLVLLQTNNIGPKQFIF